MGKYQTYGPKDDINNRGTKMHPVWRGVGFALLIILPIISYFGTIVILDANALHGWVKIPGELLASSSDPMLYVKIILTLTLTFLFFAVFSLIYSIIYGMFAPPRYGPLDVPPASYRGKPYKR